MLSLLGLCGLPGRGGQLSDPSDRPLAEFGKDVPKIVAQVDVQTPAGFHHRGNGGDFGSGLRAADMQPVLAAYGPRPHGSFAPVVVDLDPAVPQILFQPAPLSQGIITGL